MPEEIIKRELPRSIEAEQCVIASMLMDRDAILTAAEILQKDDFYASQYGVLFENLTELFNEGSQIDLIILQNRLLEKQVPPQISSLDYIGDIMNKVPNSSHVRQYAQIVAEKSLLRNIIKVNDDISNRCYSGSENSDLILEYTEKEIFNLLSRKNHSDFVPIKKVVMEVLDRIDMASKNKGNVTGIPTGFTYLDHQLSGFQNSDLILVAARPSMGKTAFVLNIAQYVAFKKKKGVLFFSMEMSNVQLVNRLFALESMVNSQNIRTGDLADSEWEKLIDASAVIGTSNLIIDDTPGITISELRSKSRKYKLEHDISLIIIDYLQLMAGNGRASSREQEISEISRSLKALARELNVPVVALSQLSRAVEKRTDRRPMLSDLRESGAIEQDADVVMFIYRDDYYNKDSEDKNIAEIIVAKQRNGPIGTVNLLWLSEYTKFANYLPPQKSE